MKFAIWFRVVTLFATMAGLLYFLPITHADRLQALRGWWADRVTVWRLRAEWRRRQRAKAAATRALRSRGASGLPRLTFPEWYARRLNRRSALAIAIGAGVGLLIALGLTLPGCGGRYPIDGAPPEVDAAPLAPADAGADAHEPQCQDLTPGEEFYAADTGAQLATLILNDKGCTRFCRNTAGGATCISAANELVRCSDCQAVSP